MTSPVRTLCHIDKGEGHPAYPLEAGELGYESLHVAGLALEEYYFEATLPSVDVALAGDDLPEPGGVGGGVTNDVAPARRIGRVA